jgi:hypothetical protein
MVNGTMTALYLFNIVLGVILKNNINKIVYIITKVTFFICWNNVIIFLNNGENTRHNPNIVMTKKKEIKKLFIFCGFDELSKLYP